MERREFAKGSAVALLAVLTEASAELGLETARAGPSGKGTDGTKELFQLTKRNDPEVVKVVYEGSGRGLTASDVPYVYAYYDEGQKKFNNPLEIAPTLAAASYTLESTLHSFNIRKADQDNFRNLKNQVQLGFNATAPVTKSDQLTWVFMNAIDVFLAKDKNRPDQLTKFTKDNGNGTALQSNPKVSVVNGLVSLQVTAFGQKRDGFWKKFFDFVTAAAGSAIISDVSKGFGIPGLATDALKFVDHVIDVFADQEKLVPLWKTGSLEFAVHDQAKARFKMKPGLWVTIDSDYAQQTNFLEGHSVDLQYQSFRITDKQAKPIDANYLLTELKFST